MKTLVNPSIDEFIKTTRKSGNLFMNDTFMMVSEIMEDIYRRGDIAVENYSRLFDGYGGPFRIELLDEKNYSSLMPQEITKAILKAKQNIETFHLLQKPKDFSVETSKGVVCTERFTPIERVGIYVPGGTAPLVSTVLMLAIPAKIAGCKEIVLFTPPSKQGQINTAILYAAAICGVTEVYALGGIQAIGAMALGTQTIRKVDKIVGPGNTFVTMAKQWASARGVAVDMPAGPSEVAVIADQSAKVDYVAADLLSQAEHAADAQTLLLTNSVEVAENVSKSVQAFMKDLPRKQIIEKALENMFFVVLNTLEDCVAYANQYAPEHLIINCWNAKALAQKIVNAGSVFVGEFTTESAGDYASGTNHTLPTGGAARAFGALGVIDFMKRIQFQSLSVEGLKNIASTVITLAETEGLDAHKFAVEIRLNSINQR